MNTDPDAILKSAEEAIKKAVDHTLHEFSTLHTGKATPSMVEGVTIDAYGSSMRIRDVAAITTPDTRTIQIQPWDKSVVNSVKKGIETANLGFNPSVDGTVIRINIPELSKERRQELVKVAHNLAEEGRVGIRAARHDAMTALKQAEKEKDISEDERKAYEKEVQKVTDHYTNSISDHLKNKESDLLQI